MSRSRKRHVRPPAPAPSVWSKRLEGFGHSRAAIVAASIAVLIPCFWQSRLQAGDLGSQVYNAWLADLIGQGQAPGLALVHQNTNILFDWILTALFHLTGAAVAQRISVSVAVLAFVWGAFAFAGAVSGSRAWHMLPVIAMLAYGWVFHMGFFNFYMSLGFCLLAIALCWKPSRVRFALAAILLSLAWLAHALPVVWAGGLLAYWWALQRLNPRLRAYLLVAACVGMAVLSVAVRSRVWTLWLPSQALSAIGFNQLWVFDGKYRLIAFSMLAIWGVPVIELMRKSGWREVFLSVPFQFCLLTAVACLVFPTSVLIPGYKHTLAYIADRMSLPLTVCFTVLAAAGPKRVNLQYFAGAVAIFFFAFLFHDERALNAFEDRIDRRVAALPANQRVISAIYASALRVNALGHMLDRACVGRCYSYANYEPSTAQFRVRAVAESPLVVSTYEDSWALQAGTYQVKDRDLPLYQINLDAQGRMITLSLKAGAPCSLTQFSPW